MKQDEDGKWQLAEGTPEDIAYGVTLEKRRRDTQAGYTTAQQKLKSLEVERDALANKVSELASKTFKLSSDELEQLEDLKVTDPEAWRLAINQHEDTARESAKTLLAETAETANAASETEHRRLVLEEFTQKNGNIITDVVLANDVPPRFSKALENNEVTFEEFLENVKTYLETPKKVSAGDEVVKAANLNNTGGGATVTKASANKDAVESYKKATF